jgi:predicted transposase YbfD/YdcC
MSARDGEVEEGFDAEDAAIVTFERSLELLQDPRRRQGQRYPLRSVVVISLMAMVCGADDAEAISGWGSANEDWLATILDLPHGTPSQDVILAVFAGLDTREFEVVFMQWAHLLRARLAEPGNHIAVDGKTIRGSRDSDGTMVHQVSAWLSGQGLVLGRRAMGEKRNEIQEIPELLHLLDLRGSTVTIDAIGCQTKIAATIQERGGEYLLQIKANQKLLEQAAQQTFADAEDSAPRPMDHRPSPELQVFEETDKGHGRLETRTTKLCRDLERIPDLERWPGATAFVQVTRRREDLGTGHISEQTAWYLASSSALTAKRAHQLVRGHWDIENGLHWVFDMAFHEDRARQRNGNCAANFSLVRAFALNLIKQEKTLKLGVANKRKRAGWDHDYLMQVLTGIPET